MKQAPRYHIAEVAIQPNGDHCKRHIDNATYLDPRFAQQNARALEDEGRFKNLRVFDQFGRMQEKIT